MLPPTATQEIGPLSVFDGSPPKCQQVTSVGVPGIQSNSGIMQQITLERGDLLQLVPISNTGTIKLLPLGKKNKVRIIASIRALYQTT